MFRRKTIHQIAFWIATSTTQCTYDSTPPTQDQLNDQKPRLMIDARDFTAQRRVQIQYTDSLGTVTLQGADLKTDLAGRILFPLEMARGTRSYTIIIRVDQSGDGAFTTGVGDRQYSATSNFLADAELKLLTVVNSVDFANY